MILPARCTEVPMLAMPHPEVAGTERLLCAALLCALIAMPAFAHVVRAPHALAKDRSHGYLGIEFHDTSNDAVVAFHLMGPRGAEIIMVDHDGPAGKAGLQPHDIVLQVDGQNIVSGEDLSRRIHESAPGKVISLSIVRMGRAMTLSAKLANQKDLERNAWQRPDPPPPDDGVENVLVQRYTVDAPPPEHTPSRSQNFIGTVLHTGPYTGASLETMEPQLANYFGAPPKVGLLVHEVDANSPAAFAGLRAGDVVLRMDSVAVSSTSDWTKHVRASKGQPVSLTILRERHQLNLMLTPDPKRHSELQTLKVFVMSPALSS